MSKDSILTSVGIDIGTTTTKLVISYLTLSNVMPGSRIPRIEISNKSLFYASEVRFTPFIDRETIDEAAVRKMISEEYQKAGITPDKIDTGAIIITGESAKKENAEKLVHALAEFSGDFVVATAGPELESIIAGKGSGAEDHVPEGTLYRAPMWTSAEVRRTSPTMITARVSEMLVSRSEAG